VCALSEAYGEVISFESGGHIPMALLMIVPLAPRTQSKSELGSNPSHIGVRFTGMVHGSEGVFDVSFTLGDLNGHCTKPLSWPSLTNRPLGKLGWLLQTKTVRNVQSIDCLTSIASTS
jgi:hypothetical protein